MGIKGTEAAKEAAEMVLLDDNFASIVAAVHEGRVVHDNIRKVVAWTLPTNGGEALTVIAALLFGLVLPMTAAQILWVNLVAESALGLALAFEPAEPGVMRRCRGAPTSPCYRVFRLARGGGVAARRSVPRHVLRGARARPRPRDRAHHRGERLVVLQVFYLFNVRYLHMTSLTLRGALGTPAVLWALAVIGGAAAVHLRADHAVLVRNAPARLPRRHGRDRRGAVFMFLLEAEKPLLRRFGLLSSRLAVHQHRGLRELDDLVGDAAERQTHEPAVAVRGHQMRSHLRFLAASMIPSYGVRAVSTSVSHRTPALAAARAMASTCFLRWRARGARTRRPSAGRRRSLHRTGAPAPARARSSR